MRRRRSAKIVATLGPASSTPEQIRALFDAGVDVFRLNFSHGTHDEHAPASPRSAQIEHESRRARSASSPICRARSCVSALSPRARSSSWRRARFRLDLDRRPGDATRAPLPHPEIFAALETGDRTAARRRQGAASRSRAAAPNSPRP